MILLNEVRRIFAKAPVMVLLCCIIPVFVISAIIIGIKPPSPPLIDLRTSDFNQALVNFESGNPETVQYSKAHINESLNDLRDLIYAGDIDFTEDLYEAFELFAREWNPFITIANDGSRTYDEYLMLYQDYFLAVNESYKFFEKEIDKIFGGASRLLITPTNYNIIHKWMEDTAKAIVYDQNFDARNLNEAELNQKRIIILEAWDKYAHKSNELEKHDVYRALHNSTSIIFTEAQKEVLRNIYANQIEPNRLEFEREIYASQNYNDRRLAISKYADYVRISCEYLNLDIKEIQSKNVKGIAKFKGFNNYNRAAVSDQKAVLGVLVFKGKTSFDYSIPYQFCKVLNKNTGTTVHDFIFNNLELISIPLIILACLIVVFCIFDDIRKKTVFTALLSPSGRRRVIFSKLLACVIAIAAVTAIFSFLFLATVSLATGGATAPAVLYAFGGKARFISPFNLLLIYLLSLFFKILFFGSITAFFCIDAESYKEIILKAASVIGAIIALNILFTVIFSFVFYQYLPLASIDFAGFFGIRFMLSRHSASVFIWFTLPIMLLIWAAIIVATVVKFERRDF